MIIVPGKCRQRGFFAPSALFRPRFNVDAAYFDGTNDYLEKLSALTGAADSKTGILSFWIRFDAGSGAQRDIFNSRNAGDSSSGVTVVKGTDDKIYIGGNSSVPAQVMNFNTSAMPIDGTTWKHILASWNAATTTLQLYVDDVSDKTESVNNNATIVYTDTKWWVGASSFGTTFALNGNLAEFFFAPGQYLDFSVTANRRKFNSGGKPANLGATGSAPTGTAPLIYLHLDDGETAANFATNRGTGGNFSVVGALTTASTSPSD